MTAIIPRERRLPLPEVQADGVRGSYALALAAALENYQASVVRLNNSTEHPPSG